MRELLTYIQQNYIMLNAWPPFFDSLQDRMAENSALQQLLVQMAISRGWRWFKDGGKGVWKFLVGLLLLFDNVSIAVVSFSS